ncbi:MAG: hypothetical protein ABII64_00030 [Elusimicrobiota bacterium]
MNKTDHLTSSEYNFLNYFLKPTVFNKTHTITDLKRNSRNYSRYSDGSDTTIKNLIAKKVLSLSPDARLVKYTDLGLELYNIKSSEQEKWEQQPIIKVSSFENDKDQILINSGEMFKANRLLREIFSSANKSLSIIDGYLGSNIFDILEDTNNNISLRIITTSDIKSNVKAVFEAYKNQYKNASIKILSKKLLDIHDRYLFVDKDIVYHFGHSLKDLGKKTSSVHRIKDEKQLVELRESFEKLWNTKNE